MNPKVHPPPAKFLGFSSQKLGLLFFLSPLFSGLLILQTQFLSKFRGKSYTLKFYISISCIKIKESLRNYFYGKYPKMSLAGRRHLWHL